jgi:hypothetical protein
MVKHIKKLIYLACLMALVSSLLTGLASATTCIDQEVYDGATYISSVYYTRYGERFDNQPVGVISSISLLMYRYGNLGGTATCTVRAVSDDSLLGTLGSISASTISTSYQWYTFDTGTATINSQQDVRVLLEYAGGDADKRIVIAVTRESGLDNCASTSYQDGNYTDVLHDTLSFKDFCYTGMVEPEGMPDCETLSAEYIDLTSAWIYGRVIDDGNVSCQGYFQYGIVGGVDSNLTPETNDMHSGNTTWRELSSLLPSTEYWYSFTAYNEYGSDDGGYMTFTTFSLLPVAIAVEAHSVTATGAHLVGYVEQAGNYTEWSCGKFIYRHDLFDIWTECVGGLYNGLTVETAIGNLSPDSDYEWYFLVQNEQAYDFSTVAIFHTADRTSITIPIVRTLPAELSRVVLFDEWTDGFKFYGHLIDNGGVATTYGFEWRGNGTDEEWIRRDLGSRAYQGQDFWAYLYGTGDETSFVPYFEQGHVYEYRATCLNSAGRGYGEILVIAVPVNISPGTTPGIELPPWVWPFEFTINQTVKTILGIVITLICMVLIVFRIRTSGGLFAAAAFGLGMTIVFTVVGWYSLWIILLIGSIVGLIIFLILLGKR